LKSIPPSSTHPSPSRRSTGSSVPDLSPYYGWTIERLQRAIRPSGENGEGKDHPFTLIMEVKGRPDPLEQVKREAAQRWVDAVNTEGSFGRWGYAIVRDPKETAAVVEAWVGEMERG